MTNECGVCYGREAVGTILNAVGDPLAVCKRHARQQESYGTTVTYF